MATLLAQQAPELAGGGLAQAPPGITRIDSAAAPHTTDAAPQALGFEDEVSCFGYIGPESEEFIAAVIGAENEAEQEDFTEHNLLYLDAGYDRG
ncbi:MAG TPA: hypothetical protein VMT25_01125, partial [Thermoanaerobaculia bacterium]|nr:hypothetical protein [Thermoanaerobaculia bacterium]